jgi:hypothetical protein
MDLGEEEEVKAGHWRLPSGMALQHNRKGRAALKLTAVGADVLKCYTGDH